MARKKHRVGAENRGDCPRRTHKRDSRVGVHGDEGECGAHPPGDVHEDVSQPPERLLDIVSENPEEPHVEDNVGYPAVKEHRGQHGKERNLLRKYRLLRSGETSAGEDLFCTQRLKCCDLTTDRRPPVEELLPLGHSLLTLDHEEHEQIGDYETDRDERSNPRRVDVFQREHLAILLGSDHAVIGGDRSPASYSR